MIYIIIIIILIVYIIYLLYKKKYIIEGFRINGIESYKYLKNTLDENDINGDKNGYNNELISLKNKLKDLKEYSVNMTACCNYYREKAICDDLKNSDICIKSINTKLPDEKNTSIKINTDKLYENSLKYYENEYKEFLENNKSKLKDCEYNLKKCITPKDIDCIKYDLIKEEDCNKYDYMKLDECSNNYILPDECINKGYIKEKNCKINKPANVKDYDKFCVANGYMKNSKCLNYSELNSYARI